MSDTAAVETNERREQRERVNWWSLALISAAVVALVWIGYWRLAAVTNSHWDGAARFGTFGDSFGALNTLFSGLAFAALVVTIVMQHHQLRLQQKELRLQKEEMRRSADALTEQVATARSAAAAQNILSVEERMRTPEVDDLRKHVFSRPPETELEDGSIVPSWDEVAEVAALKLVPYLDLVATLVRAHMIPIEYAESRWDPLVQRVGNVIGHQASVREHHLGRPDPWLNDFWWLFRELRKRRASKAGCGA